MFIVKKSGIQGKGLYTDRPIRGRKKIGELAGERISIAEANRRCKGQRRIAIVELSDKEAIDGSVGSCPFQWVNHSCTPNGFIRIAYGRAEFYTLRHIKAGEELTCDYGESQHEGTLPCCCGSTKCRKFI